MSVGERKPLSLVSKICFGLSGFLDMPWTVFGAYANIYLVEIAQLPPLFGTSVAFGGRALDAVCNFIVAPLIEKTDTRWGKIKPWLLGSLLLFAPMYTLVWYDPDVVLEGKLAWYLVLYILFTLAKTALAVSTRTYVMYLSPDSEDRDSATAYRGLFGLVSMIAGIAIHGQIVASYTKVQIGPCANGTNNPVNTTNSTMDHALLAEEKTGYLISAGVIAAITFVCILAPVVGTTEQRDNARGGGTLCTVGVRPSGADP
ncbi:sodium-dependent lysophosphatidylcholine symporter 1-B-like isoform X2 [Branchiostoma floridae]|uniref:Sodium-dependent lysophosphatidylcholine symporter 1-B-like isoform X2 n=1 Tax=Branchiostoma floridae TaxID=7739 RepID=A0A9J7KLW9_BRAFL|nr:sodium-dependent lysophosphatidylcholine symporter 1-B-like isoform X2 [Branchiostoma floridae]